MSFERDPLLFVLPIPLRIPLADNVAPMKASKRNRLPHHGGALPSTESDVVTKYDHRELVTDDIEGIHDFIRDAEIVEGRDELWEILSQLWPELLHKIKPPRAVIH